MSHTGSFLRVPVGLCLCMSLVSTGCGGLPAEGLPPDTLGIYPAHAWLYVSESILLGVVPSNAVVDWSSSRPEIATVSSNGLVTSLAAGSTTVSATSGEVTANAEVHVMEHPLGPPPRRPREPCSRRDSWGGCPW